MDAESAEGRSLLLKNTLPISSLVTLLFQRSFLASTYFCHETWNQTKEQWPLVSVELQLFTEKKNNLQ